MSGDLAIKIEGLWKRYGLPLPEFVGKALNMVRGGSHENGDRRPWALKDLNLEVRRGETIGIIGRNGAGKSTLLKVLAGVSTPTRGRVEVYGRIFPMIELNAGLHMELTGRENVKLLAAVMGLSRKEIEDKLPDIEDFTELGEWFDRPVRMYSSGMLGRLGFGVAVNIRSDVVLIDETFSVGDMRFQNKSLARVKEMRESGCTVLLVSHSLETLQFVARHGILLEEGSLIYSGTALDTINTYETLVFRSEQQRLDHQIRNNTTTRETNVLSSRLFGPDGQTLTEVRAGEPFGIEVDLSLNESCERPVFSLGIHNAAGILCKWNVSAQDELLKTAQCDRYLLQAWYPENRFSNGAYEVRLEIRYPASPESSGRIAGILSFAVTGPGRARGVVAGKCSWQLLPHQIDSEKSPDLAE